MSRRRQKRSSERLRRVIARMPEPSRRAMLASARTDEIIVGAYTTRDGGVCPMLGAHRRGGRCDLAAFAKAWDRYTGVKDGRPRPATDRERRTLEAMLTDSLALDAGPTDLGRAVAEVKADRRRRAGDAARCLGLGWLHELDHPVGHPTEPIEDFETDAAPVR
jgi:hypothetical protein